MPHPPTIPEPDQELGSTLVTSTLGCRVDELVARHPASTILGQLARLIESTAWELDTTQQELLHNAQIAVDRLTRVIHGHEQVLAAGQGMLQSTGARTEAAAIRRVDQLQQLQRLMTVYTPALTSHQHGGRTRPPPTPPPGSQDPSAPARLNRTHPRAAHPGASAVADHAASVTFAFSPHTGIHAHPIGDQPVAVHRILWQQDFLYDTDRAAYRQPDSVSLTAGLLRAHTAAATLYAAGHRLAARPGLAQAVLPAQAAAPDVVLYTRYDGLHLIGGSLTAATRTALGAQGFTNITATGDLILDETKLTAAPLVATVHRALEHLHHAGAIVHCDPSVLIYLASREHRHTQATSLPPSRHTASQPAPPAPPSAGTRPTRR